jgi:hypothetical protein
MLPNNTITVSKYDVNATSIAFSITYLSVRPNVIKTINNNIFGLALTKPLNKLGSHALTHCGISDASLIIPMVPTIIVGMTSLLETGASVKPNLIAKYAKGKKYPIRNPIQ